ncbi:hypothetical protein DFH08DRAFT_871125 [Mycena albidolilacea]|uniref:F-box domain-containing protein n=1 Tax=Mycena albidolilacea TaxID=1033008 RepID=A0AAD6ZZH7_9AGAR|nr:hypothetical protein DFH08DRAFT_871125 [Mycena albidolilacea]
MAGSLPPDVLIEVFRLIPHPELYWHRYGLLDVTGVNKTWRSAALESGSLWSCIRTENRRDLSLLPLLLERSRISPLDVRLDLFCNQYGNPSGDTTPRERAEVVQALLPHIRRIQKLYIRHQMLEPDSEDMETILRLVGAGLEFTILTEYTHKCVGDDDDSAESATLNFTASNLLKASLDGVCPREWSTFLAPTLVELHIASIDMDVLGTAFQRCQSLTSLRLHNAFEEAGPLSHPGPLTPPPSIRTLDLHMSMPEIIAVLKLFSTSPTLHSITICDDQGLTARELGRKKPHPILTHMLRGLAPLTAFEVYGDQDVILRDAAGRTRRFQVEAEDDPCYETGALWAFLAARYDAHHTVRTILGATTAWGSLAPALELHQPEPPVDSGVELQIILDDYRSFQESCEAGDTPPLHLAVLSKVTLQPPVGVLKPRCSVEAVLQMLSMVRSERHGVVVCLGELSLKDVTPRSYVAKYQTLADGLTGVGPAGMWLPCAHCVARAGEIQNYARWCVHCRMGDDERKERCDNNWHRGWP